MVRLRVIANCARLAEIQSAVGCPGAPLPLAVLGCSAPGQPTANAQTGARATGAAPLRVAPQSPETCARHSAAFTGHRPLPVMSVARKGHHEYLSRSFRVGSGRTRPYKFTVGSLTRALLDTRQVGQRQGRAAHRSPSCKVHSERLRVVVVD